MVTLEGLQKSTDQVEIFVDMRTVSCALQKWEQKIMEKWKKEAIIEIKPS